MDRGITVEVYEEEGWWRIVPHREDIDVPGIIRGFDLEPLEAYFARSTRFQDEHRP